MKHCINKYILGSLLFGAMTGVTSCNLDYNPVDTYSDITEGVQTNTGDKLEFQTKADVESALTAIYELMKKGLILDFRNVVEGYINLYVTESDIDNFDKL